MGRGYQVNNSHRHAIVTGDVPNFQLSHTIHSFRLGRETVGALDGTRFFVDSQNGTTGLLQHFLTITPAVSSQGLESNRYDVNRTVFRSITNQTTGKLNNVLPGVFFILTMSKSLEVTEEDGFSVLKVLRLLLVAGFIMFLAICMEVLVCADARRSPKSARARVLTVV